MHKKSTPEQSTWVQRLSVWFTQNARQLPWRENQDPYRIWLSEVMLQQTQVTTVIPYFERFLAAFPTLTDLAKAPESRVLELWSGLGYYSRARNLKKGAETILSQFGGEFPQTVDKLREVPGIGRYTAGAILSIAFNLPEPLVDGNVQRVFARLFGHSSPIEETDSQKFFWEKATLAVREASTPRIFNQALMELGATVCIKGQPRCERCPIVSACVAKARGWEKELPVRRERRSSVQLWWAGFIVHSRGRFFLQQNPQGSWWEGLWDLPRVESACEDTLHDKVADYFCEIGDATVQPLSKQSHTVTHHKINFLPYRIAVPRRGIPGTENGKWFSKRELESLPMSSLVRKVLSDSDMLK